MSNNTINKLDANELFNHLFESFDQILTFANISPGVRMQMIEELRQKERTWIERKVSKQNIVLCPYCDGAEPLLTRDTNGVGIAIKRGTSTSGPRLLAYGYDIHGSGSNGLSVKIRYCPICGKYLGPDEQ